MFIGSVQIISRLNSQVSSRCLHYFPAATLMGLFAPPTWWLHTGLSIFAQKQFDEYLKFGNPQGAKTWRNYITISWLKSSRFTFFFSRCVTVKQTLEQDWSLICKLFCSTAGFWERRHLWQSAVYHKEQAPENLVMKWESTIEWNRMAYFLLLTLNHNAW